MPAPKDLIKKELWLQHLKVSSQKYFQSEEGKKQRLEQNQKLAKDPEWLKKRKEIAILNGKDLKIQEKRSISMKKYFQSDEGKKQRLEHNQKLAKNPDWKKNHLKSMQSPEYIQKQRENAISQKQDPEYIKKYNDGIQKRSLNKEWLENVRKASIITHQDPEWIKKNKEAVKKLSQDPEWIKKNKEAAIKRSQDPDWIKNNKEAMAKRSLDPDWQKMITERNKAMAQDPEHCKRISMRQQGITDPNDWKGNTTPLYNAIRALPENKEWKKRVFERDGYKDADTGDIGYLHAHHHKKSFSQILKDNNIKTIEDARNCKELWDPDNGKTMTRENHMRYHGLVGEDEGE